MQTTINFIVADNVSAHVNDLSLVTFSYKKRYCKYCSYQQIFPKSL